MKAFVRDPILQNSVEFIRNNENHSAMVNLNAVRILLQALAEREKEIERLKKAFSEVDRAYSDSLWERPSGRC